MGRDSNPIDSKLWRSDLSIHDHVSSYGTDTYGCDGSTNHGGQLPLRLAVPCPQKRARHDSIKGLYLEASTEHEQDKVKVNHIFHFILKDYNITTENGSKAN